MPVVFFNSVLVSLPAFLSTWCVLPASRFTSALVSRPAFFAVLLTSCATLFSPPGLWVSCARAVSGAASDNAAATRMYFSCNFTDCLRQGIPPVNARGGLIIERERDERLSPQPAGTVPATRPSRRARGRHAAASTDRAAAAAREAPCPHSPSARSRRPAVPT